MIATRTEQLETAPFERTPEEIIADALSRYSVMDLREQSDEQLTAGERKFANAPEVKTLEKGITNLIHWWKIESSGKRYEVRRFENFVFCSCLDFFFGKTCCKHIFVTTKAYRWKVNEEADNAPYLKQTPERKITRIGNIPI